VRGSSTGWYPYPFVDVSEHGYGGVLVRAIVFLLAFAAGAALFAILSDRSSARRSTPDDALAASRSG
jgi:hypothetical protein